MPQYALPIDCHNGSLVATLAYHTKTPVNTLVCYAQAPIATLSKYAEVIVGYCLLYWQPI